MPPCTTDPDVDLSYLTDIDVMDRIDKVKNIEANSKEEQAKEIAHFYCDRCSQLKLEVLRMKSDMTQLKTQCFHEKNQICHFGKTE